MDRVGGAFESITGTGENTNQSQSRASIPTGTQTQQHQSSPNTNTTTDPSIPGTLSSDTGAGGDAQGEIAETQAGIESENPATATDALNVSQAKDEQIGEFIRHQYRSSTGDGAEEGK